MYKSLALAFRWPLTDTHICQERVVWLTCLNNSRQQQQLTRISAVNIIAMLISEYILRETERRLNCMPIV
jgi:hypothetical protein